MARAFSKGVIRSITGSLGRFLAIAVISALGCGFYAGLRMTAPDMQLAGDLFYDGTHTADIRVVSSLGLDDEDIARLAAVEGVEAVMPDRELDATAEIDGSQSVIRIHGFDVGAARASDTSDGVNALSDDSDYLNRAILVEGRWPEAPGECLLAADPVLDHTPLIGSTVALVEAASGIDIDKTLATREFTVVGFMRTGYYPASSNTGPTSLGNGTLDTFIYISNDDFADDAAYAGAFIAVEGARELHSAEGAYELRVAEVMERLESSAPEFASARLAGIKADAQAELDDARAEYEDERADAQAQLDDAQAQLDGAKSQLDSAASQLAGSRSQLADAAEEVAQGERELAEGRAAYEAGAAELAERRAAAEAQFDDAQAQIDAQAEQLEAAQALMPVIEAGMAEVDAAIEEAAAGIAELDALIEQLQAADPDNPQLAIVIAQREAASAILSELSAQRDGLRSQLDQMSAGAEQLAAAQAALDEQRAAAEEQLSAAQAELDAAAAQLAAAEEALAAGRSQYEDGRSRYYQGLSEYQSGVASYQSGLAELSGKRAEADAEFADAEARLADAQGDIDALDAPDWFLLDRSKNIGIESFKADSNRIDRIARVFPFLFFLVAALVSLTTMTRMVEEERVLIGTFKALGYSTGRILGKYLVYAFVACAAGAIAGIVALSLFLPYFIMEAYAIVYCVPSRPVPIDLGIAALSGGLGIAITLGATIWAVVSTLREQPASLMLPRVPKAGKRILLERVTPLWSRMSFLQKVTARNLFRYKRRFFMAVIGIAGCTALLLTGFGLNNAINDIIDKQWGEIYHYQMVVHLKDDVSGEDWQRVRGLVGDPGYASDSLELFSANMIALEEGGKQQRLDLLVPLGPDSLYSYVTLRERKGHEPLALDDGGVLVSEKLASKLGLAVGDELVVYDQDLVGNATGAGHAFVIGGVMEGYVGQQVYYTPACYERVMGEAAAAQALFVKSTDDPQLRQELVDGLLAIDGVNTAGYNDDTIESYRTMLKSVNAVVIVLIVAAAALAFVVLYNLTNINITERIREIATLKVLGFTPGEVNAYIYRETIILSLIGAALGCVLGIAMEAFVVTTAEVDQVMFGRDIHTASFAMAYVLTMAFSGVVALFMRGKLAAIDMVESLKSIE